MLLNRLVSFAAPHGLEIPSGRPFLWGPKVSASAIIFQNRGSSCEEAPLKLSTIRVLVVDDYKPWLRFISSMLQKQSNLQVIGEVSDGLEAVQKAQELKPDLILLDVGLPTMNGIEAARQIRQRVPESKILIVSENRSWDVAEEPYAWALTVVS